MLFDNSWYYKACRRVFEEVGCKTEEPGRITLNERLKNAISHFHLGKSHWKRRVPIGDDAR